MKIYELTPNNGRKSFYVKAHVLIDDDGTETLLSYGTPVVKRTLDGKMIRLWNGWSATTGRHIVAFCGVNKKGYLELPTT